MNNFLARGYSYLIRIDDPKIHKEKYPFKLVLKLTLRILNLVRWVIALMIINRVDSLSDFYSKIHIFWYRGNEGHTQQSVDQTNFLSKISKEKDSIFEIGFNGGHSAETFLTNNLSTTLLSCDIGWYYYSKFGEMYLKNKFGKRFELIIEDSKKLVPQLTKHNQNKFDLIYIDGGHEYEDAIQDILNSKKLAHEDTVLMVDDVVNEDSQNITHSNIGPSKAWKELIANKLITPLEYLEFNDNNLFRSAVVGRYEKDSNKTNVEGDELH